MRFAVQGLSGIEDFGLWGPDMGEVAQKAAALQGRDRMLSTVLDGQAGVAGIQGNTAAVTGELLGEAEAAAGRDAMWGSIFNTIGQVGGAGISKFGKPKIYEGTTQAAQNVADGYTPGLGIPLSAFGLD